MTLHNYRSRQVHKTLNGVNPSSSFRDMHSAKSGPNLWQIWQVFDPWASPYGANGQMTMTLHNYRPRQFHRTLNGENPIWDYRDGFHKFGSRPPGRTNRDDNTPPARRAEGNKNCLQNVCQMLNAVTVSWNFWKMGPIHEIFILKNVSVADLHH